jgi:hypothetical protein
MLEVSASRYILLGRLIETLTKCFHAVQADSDIIIQHLEALKYECDEVGLEYSSNLLKRALVDLP